MRTRTSEPITATELRAQIYRVLDRVLATGKPQRVRRGDRTLVISPEAESPRKRLDLDRLPRRQAINCTPDELVEQGWEDAWKPDL